MLTFEVLALGNCSPGQVASVVARRGIATPKREMDIVSEPLKRAKEDYEQWRTSDTPKSR